ncbi:MAG: tRNA 2-thiocytidine(32) synthetase TtcA, partial [bacterium]|nr:tRNA 2-thiocytidine(32) synthetase TtcA [bacterium]
NKKFNKKFIEKIRNKVGEAIVSYNLIEPDDTILIALSGGKDSLVLLDALAMWKRYRNRGFNLTAVHIDLTAVPYEIDTAYIETFCRERDVPFASHTIDQAFDTTTREGQKSPCFLCSFHRRKALFLQAKELGCNKIAFGHHMDDAIETLFMNMIFHGSICSMPGKLTMFEGGDGEFDIIRPLILLTDEELQTCASIQGFRTQKKECPYGETTKRDEVKRLIAESEKINPNAKINLFRSMRDIQEEYLP